jgi:hypothetical protein
MIASYKALSIMIRPASDEAGLFIAHSLNPLQHKPHVGESLNHKRISSKWVTEPLGRSLQWANRKHSPEA